MPDLIDNDTPQSTHVRTGFDGREYNLVFPDEFSVDGRTFYPGAFVLSLVLSFFLFLKSSSQAMTPSGKQSTSGTATPATWNGTTPNK
jgi:hypothetical protein